KTLLRLPSWQIGMHISLLADDETWATVSTFDVAGSPQGKLRRELFQIATDGSRRIRRICHLHSVFYSYEDSPRANISRDGKYAVFTSNWETDPANGGRRDVFIAKIDGAPPSRRHWF